jgi:hypothetical protein
VCDGLGLAVALSIDKRVPDGARFRLCFLERVALGVRLRLVLVADERVALGVRVHLPLGPGDGHQVAASDAHGLALLLDVRQRDGFRERIGERSDLKFRVAL